MVHKAVLGMTELQFQRRNFELSSDEALLEDQKDPEEQEQESHFSARQAQDGAQGSTHRANDLPRYSSQHETNFVCEISPVCFISSSKALLEATHPLFPHPRSWRTTATRAACPAQPPQLGKGVGRRQ